MAATSARRPPTRNRRSRAAGAATAGRLALARLVRTVAAIVALILIAGIVLVLLKANPANGIVSAIHDAAAWLAGPFDHMFKLAKARTETAVNWGIAAVVWYVIGHVIARLLAR
jgi:predicted membrane channel-forming protein YqfA (hemolysin III family)